MMMMIVLLLSPEQFKRKTVVNRIMAKNTTKRKPVVNRSMNKNTTKRKTDVVILFSRLMPTGEKA